MIPGCGSPFVFPIRIMDSTNLNVDKCMNILGEKGVEIRSLMGGTITEQPAYRHIPTDSLSNCLEISKEVSYNRYCLFCLLICKKSFFIGVHQTLNEDDVHTVASIIHDEFKS